jgi:serine/threonine protein phosphatase PrpC
MWVSAYPFYVQKAGNKAEEYEDAYWPPDQVDGRGASFRFAVADGATEASYSKVWARLLVEAYCEEQLHDLDLTAALLDLQTKWKGAVGAQPLPWYAEQKIRDGAFSSLIGFTIRGTESSGDESRLWEAMAVGDSCLFQVRDDELYKSFPLDHSEKFNSRPALLSSSPISNERLSEHVYRTAGEWQPGDVFFLMTDALACWFLKAVEEGEKPWKIRRPTQESFENWIDNLRTDGVIRNDDVTMYRVEALSEEDTE